MNNFKRPTPRLTRERRIIKYHRWNCLLRWGYYSNNMRESLELIDAIDGELVATCTVNIPEYPLDPNQIFIKDYAENEGMLKTLLDYGIIRDTKKIIQPLNSHVSFPICELLVAWGSI